MQKLKAVFFDLDGTLIDTAADFILVLNTMLKEDGLALVNEDLIRNTVSDGSRALIKLGYGLDHSQPESAPLRQRLLDLYETHLASKSVLFPGIQQLLLELDKHQIVWGIATNKPELYTRLLLQALTISPQPIVVLSPEQVAKAKPAPDSLFAACAAANCQIDEAVYIGDHQRDIECGKNAGMRTIAAAYGYIPPGERVSDWQADFTATTPQQLWPIIKQNFIQT